MKQLINNKSLLSIRIRINFNLRFRINPESEFSKLFDLFLIPMLVLAVSLLIQQVVPALLVFHDVVPLFFHDAIYLRLFQVWILCLCLFYLRSLEKLEDVPVRCPRLFSARDVGQTLWGLVQGYWLADVVFFLFDVELDFGFGQFVGVGVDLAVQFFVEPIAELVELPDLFVVDLLLDS